MENAKQIDFWNNSPGRKWQTNQQQMDTLLAGVSQKLLEISQIEPGMKILEIGCGTGALSLDISKRVSSNGLVVALDVSTPLLDTARQRAIEARRENIEFVLADAQIHPFNPQSVDQIISRFGVMFFEDPAVAFANMRKSLKSEAKMVFASWSHVDDNPWFQIPRDAAVAKLGKPEPLPPTAPGPTAFADLDHVHNFMREAGILHVHPALETIPLVIDGDTSVAAKLACSIGPASRIALAKNATPKDMQLIEEEVQENLKSYIVDDQVIVPSKINFITCQ